MYNDKDNSNLFGENSISNCTDKIANIMNLNKLIILIIKSKIHVPTVSTVV